MTFQPDQLFLRESLGCYSLWYGDEHGNRFQLDRQTSTQNLGHTRGTRYYYTKLAWGSEEKARKFAAKHFPEVVVEAW